MTVNPSSSDLVAKLLDEGDSVVAKYVDAATVGPTKEDRRNRGLSVDVWRTTTKGNSR